jgi:hypothetical protein
MAKKRKKLALNKKIKLASPVNPRVASIQTSEISLCLQKGRRLS